ncbi:MAG TPA: XdhC family protein, partial [Ktedonobacterales bacterium]
RQIFRTLLKEGLPREQLARVCAPIGLDLGAETPDEIALAIAAELLLWHRGASGGRLRDREGILARVLAGKDAAEAETDADTVADTAEAEAATVGADDGNGGGT